MEPFTRTLNEAIENTGGRHMKDSSLVDYSSLDHPEILGLLFHPRPDWGSPSHTENIEDMTIAGQKSGNDTPA